MDALLATRGASQVVDATISRLIAAMADAMLVGVAIAGCFVWARRATGALESPLGTAVLIELGLALSLAAVLFRRFRARTGEPSNRARRYALSLAVTVVLLLAAGGLSLAESTAGGLAGLWGFIALEETWAWQHLLRGPRTRPKQGIARSQSELESRHLAPAVDDLSEERVSEELASEGVTQYMIRRGDMGSETLDGWFSVELAPAQRHATAHVAICPPFGRAPQCFAEISEGPSGDLKMPLVLAYGVRFDIKLDKPAAETAKVRVEFSIQERPEMDEGQPAGELA